MERRIVAATVNGVTRYMDPDRRGIPAAVFDYQTGSFAQWAEQQRVRPEQLSIVTTPARPGYTYSAKFTAKAGDDWNPPSGTIRGEVAGNPVNIQSPSEGAEQWYAWSTYFPADFYSDIPAKDFFLYTQWHATPSVGRPVLSLRVTPGPNHRLELHTYGGTLNLTTGVWQYSQVFDLGPLTKGVWLDHRIYVKWSSNPAAGRVAVWINGTNVLPIQSTANFGAGHGVYLKQGIYAGEMTSREHVVYLTGTVVGKSMTDVRLKG